jgi:enoyl-CoA hydratase/carnithine racemase
MERGLGRATSSWLALTGQFMRAEDPAFRSWLRTVEAPEELESTVASIIKSLTTVPSTARAAYKQLLNETHGQLTPVDRDKELDAFDRHWLANDVPRELRAFLNHDREAS